MRARLGGLVGCPAARSGPPTRALGSDFLHASRRTYVIVTKPADGPIGENVWVLRHVAITRTPVPKPYVPDRIDHDCARDELLRDVKAILADGLHSADSAVHELTAVPR